MGSWERVVAAAVGGLTDVGFSPNGRHLLVVGHQGRGVFDCLTGILVARDRRGGWGFLGDDGTAEGIGPLTGTRIVLAGLMSGGRLPAEAGGWTASASARGVVLGDGARRLTLPATAGARAFGFDPTGHALVAATGDGVTLYRLSEGPERSRP